MKVEKEYKCSTTHKVKYNTIVKKYKYNTNDKVRRNTIVKVKRKKSKYNTTKVRQNTVVQVKKKIDTTQQKVKQNTTE